MADQGLDDEFKQVIAKMKPFAKRLPHKSGKYVMCSK